MDATERDCNGVSQCLTAPSLARAALLGGAALAVALSALVTDTQILVKPLAGRITRRRMIRRS